MKPTAEEYFVNQYPVYTIKGEHIPNEIHLFKEELFKLMEAYAEAVKSEPAEGAEEILAKHAETWNNSHYDTLPVSDIIAAMQEFASITASNMYPKRFVRFCIDHAEIESLEDTYLVDNQTRFYSMDDLYEYWLKNKDERN